MKYSIGVDFGTLSARALLVEVETGREVATSVYEYANGAIDDVLPSTGEKLPPDWALQDPQDYLIALETTVPAVLKEAGINAGDVVGVGIDFTACTMLPIDAQGEPLCFDPKWAGNKHAWVKLWKHHAAQPEANKINETAQRLGYDFLKRYGGRISSEWFFSKALQILDEAPEVYAAADRLIEAADWVILRMTGVEARNACTAGYKAMWEKASGFPPKEFFKALDPRFENVVDDKMCRDIHPIGEKAGELTAEMATKMGLKPGTAVAVANVDAHVAVPAATVTKEGIMVMIMGTSTCHMVLGREPKLVEGMCGYVEDGILPGFFGFEAGQSCVGDHFAWFVENCVPAAYEREADQRGISVHDLLEEKASRLKPGESGLLALDWWNGNRSVLVDVDLTGMMLGLTLTTKPEEMYRALIEATAFGTNVIIEAFESNGVAVNEIVACGGLPERNEMLMQIYADVTNREFKVAASPQTCALGSAMWGAVAAGKARGGFDNINDAACARAGVKDLTFKPNLAAHAVYAKLFEEYKKLHDYFGRGENHVMKRLKGMREWQHSLVRPKRDPEIEKTMESGATKHPIDTMRERRSWFDSQLGEMHCTCPCCGYPTLTERGGYDICPLCHWEDDGQDDADADQVLGGPNADYSLTEARTNFATFNSKYEPGRIGGPDSPAEIEAKRSVMQAFDEMRASADVHRADLWARVEAGMRALDAELERRVAEYEARWTGEA